MDILRWTFRFHNNTNILLEKKSYSYNILYQYKEFLNHKILYTFLQILETLFCKSNKNKENYFNIEYYKELKNILKYIIPCDVCCENIKLLKNNINLKKIMYSHFPNENSSDVYKYTGLTNKNNCLTLLNNKINVNNLSNAENLSSLNLKYIYKYYPILSNEVYEISIIILYDNTLHSETIDNINIKFIDNNNNDVFFVIDDHKYENYTLLNKKQEKIKIIITHKSNNISLLCLCLYSNKNTINYIVDKLLINFFNYSRLL